MAKTINSARCSQCDRVFYPRASASRMKETDCVGCCPKCCEYPDCTGFGGQLKDGIEMLSME